MTDRKQDQAWVESQRAKYAEASAPRHTLILDPQALVVGVTGESPTQRTKTDLEVRVEALEAAVMALHGTVLTK